MFKKINLGKIRVKKNRLGREQEQDIASLVESIATLGLLHPIVVRKVNEREYELLAGRRRLQALKQLHCKRAVCIVVKLDGRKAELARIDENIIRKNLSEIETCVQLAKRKEIYEELYPNSTRRGGDRKSKRHRVALIKSFSRDASDKSKIHQRTIQRKVRIGQRLKRFGKEIVGTAIENSQKDLFELSKLEHDGKIRVVLQKIQSGRADGVREALALILREKPRPENTQNSKILIIKGDSLHNEIPDGTIDVICTDWLWQKSRIPDWFVAAKMFHRVLKAGGIVILWPGRLYLAEVFDAFKAAKLKYRTIIAVGNRDAGAKVGTGNLWEREMWSPALIFSKPLNDGTQCKLKISHDFIPGKEKDKSIHEYGKNVSEFVAVLRQVVKRGDKVVDFFCGGGTTIAACNELNRTENLLLTAIGYEIKSSVFRVLKKRFPHAKVSE